MLYLKFLFYRLNEAETQLRVKLLAMEVKQKRRQYAIMLAMFLRSSQKPLDNINSHDKTFHFSEAILPAHSPILHNPANTGSHFRELNLLPQKHFAGKRLRLNSTRFRTDVL
jgi:hypothetical protein